MLDANICGDESFLNDNVRGGGMQEVSGVKMFLAVLVTLLVASGSYVVTNNLNNRTEDSEQEIDCTKQENISNENCIDQSHHGSSGDLEFIREVPMKRRT